VGQWRRLAAECLRVKEIGQWGGLNVRLKYSAPTLVEDVVAYSSNNDRRSALAIVVFDGQMIMKLAFHTIGTLAYSWRPLLAPK